MRKLTARKESERPLPPPFDPEREFFVIDSYNCTDVESQLFGYAFVGGRVVNATDSNGLAVPAGEQGAYVSIGVSDGIVTITQDFIGCYGLFLYQVGNYFAISNSFARLVEHLANKRPLTFNQQYAEEFFAGEIVPYSLKETPITEIEMLWRNAVITIDQSTRAIAVNEIDFGEDSLDLDTEQGIEALDAWHDRWTEHIRHLHASGHPLVMDLSGGFDSRLNLCLFLDSGISMQDVQVNSIDDDLHTHRSDYSVASEIAAAFNFRLTPTKKLYEGKIGSDGRKISIGESLLISLYIKGGFHKQMLFQTHYCYPQTYYFSGDGGEIFRDYWFMSVDDFLVGATKGTSRFANGEKARYKKAIENTIRTSLSLVQEKFIKLGRPIHGKNLVRNLFRESRCRHHFGAIALESYYGGKIKISPLMDRDLSRVKSFSESCKDARLMGAVILDRYQPQLLEIPLDSGRRIPESTIAEAKAINAKFPRRPTLSKPSDLLEKGFLGAAARLAKRNTVEEISPDATQLPEKLNYDKIIEQGFYRSFLSDAVREPVLSFLGQSAYDVALETASTRKYFPSILIEAALPLAAYSYLISSAANVNQNSSLIDFILQTRQAFVNSLSVNQSLSTALHGYACGRIDMQCPGTDRVIEVSEHSITTFVTTPKWLCAGENQGIVLQDYTGYLSAKIHSSEETALSLHLRGRDKRNGDSRVPIKVTFVSLKKDGVEVLDSCKTVWHDELATVEVALEAGKTSLLEAQWVPCDLGI